MSQNTEIGQTVGKGGVIPIGGIHVRAENTGIPVAGVSGHNGNQNKVGAAQGARGAQFNGVEIQPHHPKPQLSHWIILSIHDIIWSTFSFISSKFDKKSLSDLVVSSRSGIPSKSVSKFISSNASFA